jgi:hypothetical protein
MIMSHPQIEIVEVTPALAAEWLAANTHNRHLRRNVVYAYAADMRDGHWRFNGEPVKFADDGALLDGQHRLQAVIEADVTVLLAVVRGLPREAQETVDAGAKRNFADVLKLRGELNCHALAATLRRVTLWEAGARSTEKNIQPTNAQMSRTLSKYPWLRDLMVPAARVADGSGLPPSVAGLCWWLFSQLNSEDAEVFMARLRDGQNLAKGDPVYELRQAIARTRQVRGARASSIFLIALVIKAWNAYREGRPVGELRYRPGGAHPEAYPEPL